MAKGKFYAVTQLQTSDGFGLDAVILCILMSVSFQDPSLTGCNSFLQKAQWERTRQKLRREG